MAEDAKNADFSGLKRFDDKIIIKESICRKCPYFEIVNHAEEVGFCNRMFRFTKTDDGCVKLEDGRWIAQWQK